MTEPQWYDGMLDIECMGMPPAGALVGIGFAFFDAKTEQIGPRFKCAVNLADSVNAGMCMDPGTVAWWMMQSEEARRSIMWSTLPLATALKDFNEFLAQHSRPRDLRVYGNAPTFDTAIMRTAYKLTGVPCPWHYTNERCFRTLRAMYPTVEYNPDEKGDMAHDALTDVVFQINHIFKIKRCVSQKSKPTSSNG